MVRRSWKFNPTRGQKDAEMRNRLGVLVLSLALPGAHAGFFCWEFLGDEQVTGHHVTVILTES